MMSILLMMFSISIIAAVVSFLWPFSKKSLSIFAFIISLAPLILLLSANGNFAEQSVSYDWIPALSIRFSLAIDGVSLIFLYLTAIIIPLVIVSAAKDLLPHSRTFFGLVLLLQGLLAIFFTVRDLAVFTVFWEAMLLPLYFIINLWGGPHRQAASIKFLIYMIAGSALMIAAVLFLYVTTYHMGSPTFDLSALADIAEKAPYAGWLLAVFLLAFAVKTPLFPFHAWLPDAYYQASTPGTVLLSALLSKAGIYGVIRIAWGLFPTLMEQWSIFLLSLAIVGVIYGALAAWAQSDYKRLIAYSSLSHVNFILAGLFVVDVTAHEGAILQAFNHGITIAALFFAAGWLQERIITTSLGAAKGLAKYMPHLCWLTLLFVLSSVALPGTNNFVGELLILFGVFSQHPWLTALLGTAVILSVVYMLRFMQKIYFEEPSPFQQQWIDLKGKELVIALPLALLILWIGIYPAPILRTLASEQTHDIEMALREL